MLAQLGPRRFIGFGPLPKILEIMRLIVKPAAVSCSGAEAPDATKPLREGIENNA